MNDAPKQEKAIAEWSRFHAEAFPGSAGWAARSGEIVYNGAVSPSRTGLMSITGVPSIASIPSTWIN
jgi:hypothetical protein